MTKDKLIRLSWTTIMRCYRRSVIQPLVVAFALVGCESFESGVSEVESWFGADSEETATPSPTPEGAQPVFGQDSVFGGTATKLDTKTVPLTEKPVSPTNLRALQQDLFASAGDRVFFDKSSTSLKPRAHAVLVRIADWLRDHPDQGITLIGHAYEQSSRNANLLLGQKRADAVRDYLIAIGVNEDRLEAISLGNRRPYAQGDNRSAQALNRRVEAVVASW